MVDWMKRIAKEVGSEKGRVEKVRRTLYLSADKYDALGDLCAEQGWSISEVVDKLIDGLLNEMDEQE